MFQWIKALSSLGIGKFPRVQIPDAPLSNDSGFHGRDNMKLKGIPGTFLDERTASIQFMPSMTIQLEGGASARQYMAKVHDGYLCLLVSRDPCPPEGSLWHISMSHRKGWDQNSEEVFTRYPTWDELKLAKFRFIPPGIVMAILFPAKDQFYVDDHATCLHLWEVPKELAD